MAPKCKSQKSRESKLKKARQNNQCNKKESFPEESVEINTHVSEGNYLNNEKINRLTLRHCHFI